MNIEISGKDNKKKLPKTLKVENTTAFCKDGFCVMPNQDANPIIKNQKDKNLFEPI